MVPEYLSKALKRLTELLESGPPDTLSYNWLSPALDVKQLEGEIVLGNGDRVCQQLASVRTTELLSILGKLASRQPEQPGPSFLEFLEIQAVNTPQMDTRVLTAIAAGRLKQGTQPIISFGSTSEQNRLDRLARGLPTLAGLDQFKILRSMGLKNVRGDLGVGGWEVEGVMMGMLAEAVQDGLVPVPANWAAASTGIDFGEWTKLPTQPWPWYMGNSAHSGIAEYYKRQHPNPPHHVWTNFESVSSIMEEMEKLFSFKSETVIKEAFKRKKPDIFDFYEAHPEVPPGWLYEIKPWSLIAEGAMQADIYVGLLAEANAGLGPQHVPGTQDTIPAPNGWFDFECPVPGVICYSYQPAPRDAVKARDAALGRETKPLRLRDAVAAAGAAAAVTGALAVLLEALEAAGWIMAFA